MTYVSFDVGNFLRTQHLSHKVLLWETTSPQLHDMHSFVAQSFHRKRGLENC